MRNGSGIPAGQSADEALRGHLVRVAKRLVELDLNRGTSGNCSVRLPSGNGFIITPSGVPAANLSPAGMVAMDLAGQVRSGSNPSTEWRFHRDIYASRQDAGAVIHVHSMSATSLACLRRDIPPFHYMIAIAGGNTIRCAPYALVGSQQLSDAAVRALEGRKACLLANHGMIAIGRGLDEALAIAVEVEILCEQYLRALQVGSPSLLTAEEMFEVLEKFKAYGNQAHR